MDVRIQLLAIAGAGALLLIVLELVRQRRLLERYALLWIFSALVLLGLAVWRDALTKVAEAVGIAYPPNALFFIAFAFTLVLLLHFSAAVSRLADQSRVLAQRVALLEDRLRTVERGEGVELAAGEELPEAEPAGGHGDARKFARATHR